eukprot:TRINITY_DN6446_c1_g5_i4.p2 TRINITY_DN6446_c1_g5~~TRINITY_DN6446_c1_g5_i4.p2  ORF type:complete len:197 (-),score=36.31 TRINITY_DN6446_c1_g5_i4:283-873(-)
MLSNFGGNSPSLLDVPSGKKPIPTPGRSDNMNGIFNHDAPREESPSKTRPSAAKRNGDSSSWFEHDESGTRRPPQTSLRIRPRESRNVLDLPLDYRIGRRPVAVPKHPEVQPKPAMRMFPQPPSTPFQGVPEIKRGRKKFQVASSTLDPARQEYTPIEQQLGQRRKVDHRADPTSEEVNIISLRPRREKVPFLATI